MTNCLNMPEPVTVRIWHNGKGQEVRSEIYADNSRLDTIDGNIVAKYEAVAPYFSSSTKTIIPVRLEVRKLQAD